MTEGSTEMEPGRKNPETALSPAGKRLLFLLRKNNIQPDDCEVTWQEDGWSDLEFPLSNSAGRACRAVPDADLPLIKEVLGWS